MGVKKKTFLCTLDERDAAWVDSHVPVFGTRSGVLRLTVGVVRALIGSGMLKWDIRTLRNLLGKQVDETLEIGEHFGELKGSARGTRIRITKGPRKKDSP